MARIILGTVLFDNFNPFLFGDLSLLDSFAFLSYFKNDIILARIEIYE